MIRLAPLLLLVGCPHPDERCKDGACDSSVMVWDTCPNEPRATPSTLAQKAAAYEARMRSLHVDPDIGWTMGVVLKDGVDPATATFGDIASWHTQENDGLWSSLYLAAEAFRYDVTRDPEALDMIRVLMASEVDRMAITGTPGIFTRQFTVPRWSGMSCPADDVAYKVAPNKGGNRWVKVNDAGCLSTVNADDVWVTSDVCVDKKFAGGCFYDNVSKDEYSGHVFALGAVFKLVDDPAIRATAADLLGQVGTTLMEHHLNLVDWDGQITGSGRLSPTAGDDFPGFNAAMALAFLRVAADATGRADLRAFHDDCLLQKGGDTTCLAPEYPAIDPFGSYLPQAGLFFLDGCTANYNNVSMHMQSLFDLLWFEDDPALLTSVRDALRVTAWTPDNPRPIRDQHNAWFDVMWATVGAVPESDDAVAAVRDAACMLRQFPETKVQPTITPTADPTCENRFGEPAATTPFEVADRCPNTFLWWGDPYSLRACVADPTVIEPPQDYLLAYWMARDFGFLSASD